MVDLGAPPASMIPVQQDVESAGQVGRAIAGLGQQAMQITQQIYQRKQQQDESYADVRLQQVGKAYESAIESASTDDSLSADPEAVIKAVNNVAFGDGKKLYDELKHLTMSDSQRREFNVRMATLQTAAVDKAHLITQQWDVKYKAKTVKDAYVDLAKKGHDFTPQDDEAYMKGVASQTPDQNKIDLQRLHQESGYYKYVNSLESAQDKNEAQKTFQTGFDDPSLTIEQKSHLRSLNNSVQTGFQMKINADAMDASKLGIAEGKNALAKVAGSDNEIKLADILDRAAYAKDDVQKATILAESVTQGIATQENVDAWMKNKPYELLDIANPSIKAAAKGSELTPNQFSFAMASASSGGLTVAEVLTRQKTMSDEQKSSLLQEISQRDANIRASLYDSTDKKRMAISNYLTPEVMRGDAVLSTRDMQELFTLIDHEGLSKGERDTYLHMAGEALSAAQEKDGKFQSGQKNNSWYNIGGIFGAKRSQAEIKARDDVFEYLADPDVKNTLYTSNLQTQLTDAQNKLDTIWSTKDSEAVKIQKSDDLKKQIMTSVKETRSNQAVKAAAVSPSNIPTDIIFGE